MRKEDLKTGMVVETKQSTMEYLVLRNIEINGVYYDIVSSKEGWLDLDDYSEDLRNVEDDNYDIIKVFCSANADIIENLFDNSFFTLVWEREEKQKPQLTERERAYLKAYSYDYEWVARDKDGNLSVYKEKPKKSIEFACWRCGYRELVIDYNDFDFIKWEDGEPYRIKDLLEEE